MCSAGWPSSSFPVHKQGFFVVNLLTHWEPRLLQLKEHAYAGLNSDVVYQDGGLRFLLEAMVLQITVPYALDGKDQYPVLFSEVEATCLPYIPT